MLNFFLPAMIFLIKMLIILLIVRNLGVLYNNLVSHTFFDSVK